MFKALSFIERQHSVLRYLDKVNAPVEESELTSSFKITKEDLNSMCKNDLIEMKIEQSKTSYQIREEGKKVMDMGYIRHIPFL